MNNIERDKVAYSLAKEFLPGLGIAGVTPELIDKYIRSHLDRPHPDSLAELFKRVLVSAQNANLKTGVIGDALGGVEKLGVVLCEFQPREVLEKYQAWEQVLDDIEKHLHPTGKIRRAPRSIWPQYCTTILSAAQFLAQFDTADEFHAWVKFFDDDGRARAALPMLLDNEIKGLGFSLACNFLKELGYTNFAKPDVHLRDIFTELGLCAPKANDYQVFKAITRLAENAGVTPYGADKVFWLIGSGHFHNDTHIGDNGEIGSHKAQFIEYAKAQLA